MQEDQAGRERNPKMMAEDNNNASGSALGGHKSSFLAEDEKPTTANNHYQDDISIALEEDAIMEKHTAVQHILELFCLLGAGYWRLCQVSLAR